MSKKNIIPIFVPHYGCPNDCVFCNQRKITGASTDISSSDVEKTILEYLSYFKRKDNVEIAFYGGSFTAIDIKEQSELLKVACSFKNIGLVNEIRLSTRPDAINDEILQNLKKYSVDIIELGVQSLDEEVLKLSNRGHNSKVVYESSKLIKEYGFKLGLQQMIGLPGDNYSKSILTAEEFVKLNPYCVRIYPTLVIKDTALNYKYKCGEYSSLDLEESIPIVADILDIYYKANINVIRVGLQATENINFEKDVVAGAFHPAYRQFVESFYIRKALINYFKISNNIKEKIIIKASGKNISNISGQKRINKQNIINELKIKKLNLIEDNLSDFEIEIFSIKNEIIDIRDYYRMNIICT
ncbi:histone acetyltransferase (RNA polymerase elongator complex component) [Peptoniphilus olsenii]|uniref:Histone acetyltransferase (RNA polymerase elongator complex component) n=1 Tax=Peptoniphilus olsenii TaxID=411570 RepID=A0ABV2J6L0_9FIRM